MGRQHFRNLAVAAIETVRGLAVSYCIMHMAASLQIGDFKVAVSAVYSTAVTVIAGSWQALGHSLHQMR